jgi:membrane-bound lytic murein transglycosylase MltF
MKTFFFVLSLFCFASCSFPKDPENSYATAKSSGLKVGYVHHPPFSFKVSGEPAGSEVEMINEFADEQGFEVHYVYGTESELIKKMENYNLHIMVGGFKKNTMWKERAGLSTTYTDNDNCILVARGENKLLYELETYLLNYKEKK